MDALCEANGTFTLRLLKALCEHRPSENVIFSPVSLSSVLAMVLLGAKGDTAAQMAQVSRSGDSFPCPVRSPAAYCLLQACLWEGAVDGVQTRAALGGAGAAQTQGPELRSPSPRFFLGNPSPVNSLDVTIKLLS